MRRDTMQPAMHEVIIKGRAPSSKRARRNVGARVATGEGTAVLEEALRNPRRSQRGGSNSETRIAQVSSTRTSPRRPSAIPRHTFILAWKSYVEICVADTLNRQTQNYEKFLASTRAVTAELHACVVKLEWMEAKFDGLYECDEGVEVGTSDACTVSGLLESEGQPIAQAALGEQKLGCGTTGGIPLADAAPAGTGVRTAPVPLAQAAPVPLLSMMRGNARRSKLDSNPNDLETTPNALGFHDVLSDFQSVEQDEQEGEERECLEEEHEEGEELEQVVAEPSDVCVQPASVQQAPRPAPPRRAAG